MEPLRRRRNASNPTNPLAISTSDAGSGTGEISHLAVSVEVPSSDLDLGTGDD